jgi:hypothetical protein
MGYGVREAGHCWEMIFATLGLCMDIGSEGEVGSS